MIKKLFTKERIFIFVCFFLLALIGFLFAIFYKNDINNMSNKCDIVLNDDNYYKSYHLNNDGNMVSDNLVNQENYYLDDRNWNVFNIVENEYYWVSCDISFSGSWIFNSIELYINLDDDYFSLVNNLHGRFIGGFVANSTGLCQLSFEGYDEDDTIYISNIMVNTGNCALGYEPYGDILYSSTNYDDLDNEYNRVLRQLEDLDDDYNNLLDGVYSSNPFYNASVSYYYSLNSSNYAWIRTLDNDFLQYSNQFDIVSFLKYFLNAQQQQDFYDEQGIGYFKIQFDKPFLASNLTWLVVGTYPYQFDYYFTFYFDDNTSYIYHNQLTSEHYYTFNIDLNNTSYANKKVSYITFRRGASDMITSLSNNQYSIGYNDGYMNGYGESEDKYKTLVNEQKTTIEDLNNTIDLLEEQAQTSLNGLTFTMISAVMSTPFNILHDYLNWDFFGINLFSLFTSLLTFLLIVWIIKFLLGRK